ncbi:MAG: RT0821/Lpp0805 family surface protein [Alphaproteobacteria bacterium]
MRMQILTGVMVAALGLSACTETGQFDGQTAAPVMGGVVGGLLGSQFGEGSGKTVMAVAGALAGAWAGSAIAKGMTAQDQRYYDNAAYQAQSAPVGKTITWYNPDSGAQGSITPTRVGQTDSGDSCREFQQTITIGGKTEKAYGTACKQPNGSWKVMN